MGKTTRHAKNWIENLLVPGAESKRWVFYIRFKTCTLFSFLLDFNFFFVTLSRNNYFVLCCHCCRRFCFCSCFCSYMSLFSYVLYFLSFVVVLLIYFSLFSATFLVLSDILLLKYFNWKIKVTDFQFACLSCNERSEEN